MSANIFGERLKMISFGESHGPAYGVVLDGVPAGIHFDHVLLKNELARRKPGQNQMVTARQEADEYEILSGVFDDKTLGTPIAIMVRNTNQRSEDYSQIQSEPRIGHADDTWKIKFGHVDHRGGGRSSGRETLNRVIAGSVAQMIVNEISLKNKKPQVQAYATQIGAIELSSIEQEKIKTENEWPEKIQTLLTEAKKNGESYGGVVECSIKNIESGLGQPVFHKFKSDLSQAILSIGAVTGFEFGAGFSQIHLPGTEFHQKFESENYGGIRGGITTGEEVQFRVAFKPTSSIKDTAKKGRHDPCIIPRALPVVEAMVWFVIADHMLWKKTDHV